MKKTTLIYVSIAIGWLIVLSSYFYYSGIIESFGILYFIAFFMFAVGVLIIYPLYSLFFVVRNGRYYIQKGKHYAKGFNAKFFIYKKEITFEYRISGGAVQNDREQKNKIFGITSILHRKRSHRLAFYSDSDSNVFVCEYVYINGERIILNRKPYKIGEWQTHTIKLKEPIWFGRYHFPYHGGRIKSKYNYFIDLKIID